MTKNLYIINSLIVENINDYFKYNISFFLFLVGSEI